ncbi:hypothetical protein [Priestia aryabhattai]
MKKVIISCLVVILFLSSNVGLANARGMSSRSSSHSSSHSSSTRSTGGYSSGVKSYKPSSSSPAKKETSTTISGSSSTKKVITNTTKNKLEEKKAPINIEKKATNTTNTTNTNVNQKAATTHQHKVNTRSTNQIKGKDSMKSPLKKVRYTGPVPNKSKFLATALGAYLIYKYTESDGEPVYANVESGDEVEMDDIDDYKEVRSVPNNVEVDSDLKDDVNNLEKENKLELAGNKEDAKEEVSSNTKAELIALVVALIIVVLITALIVIRNKPKKKKLK